MAIIYPTVAITTAGAPVSILPWGSQAYPSGVATPTLTVGPLASIQYSTGAGVAANVVGAYLNFDWTSTQTGGAVDAGLQIVAGQTTRNFMTVAGRIRAMLRINNNVRISDVILSAVDATNTANSFSDAMIAIPASNTWTLVTSAGFNNSGWSDILSFSLTILGTSTSGNVGQTLLDIAYIEYLP
jgi:hypothetical protein